MSKIWVGWIAGAALLAGIGGTAAFSYAPQVPVPAACQTMDTSAYSPPENLEVLTHAGKRIAFSVEIADTYDERGQGMMCRNRIGDSEGMLFQFQDVSERSFWMQQTLISLDIIYISPDGRIVSIQKNARPLDRTPLPSHGAASGVLEVRGGLSEKLGLKPGDRVIHPFFQSTAF